MSKSRRSKSKQKGVEKGAETVFVYPRLLAFVKRPAVWLLTIFSTVIATYFTPAIKHVTSPIYYGIAQRVCELKRPKILPDDSRLTILISPFADDFDNWHTSRVADALLVSRHNSL